MTKYSQTFSLLDIFNNKNLKDKLPLVNYKEIERENGKVSRKTNMKTVNRMVFDTATSAARPFYKPILTTRTGDTMIINGNLVGDHNECVDAIYDRLQAQKTMMIWTANNMDMIRDALKESEKAKQRMGLSCKLYLRAKSMQEIEGMSRAELQELLKNIMENIYYGDDFKHTQEKYKVAELPTNSPLTYEQRKREWDIRVKY